MIASEAYNRQGFTSVRGGAGATNSRTLTGDDIILCDISISILCAALRGCRIIVPLIFLTIMTP